MGGMTAPVCGSGSYPAWASSVSRRFCIKDLAKDGRVRRAYLFCEGDRAIYRAEMIWMPPLPTCGVNMRNRRWTNKALQRSRWHNSDYGSMTRLHQES